MESHMDVLISIYGKEMIDIVVGSDSVWLQTQSLEDISNNIEAYFTMV